MGEFECHQAETEVKKYIGSEVVQLVYLCGEI